jgi:hypothetical protein
MCEAAVDLVASSDRMKLAIRGEVLVCEGRSWARRTAIYVPAECLRVFRGRRRDGRRLIRGLLAPALVVVTAVIAMAACYGAQRLGYAIDLAATGAWLGELMMVAMVPALVYTAAAIGRFAQPLPTVCVDIESDDSTARIEFWHRPGTDPAVDRLVQRLLDLTRHPLAPGRFPLRTGYAWQHRRPLRAMVVGGVRGMVAIYILVILVRLALRHVWGIAITPSPVVLGLFLLPWAWEGAKLLGARVLLASEPPHFRRGLRHYHREEFDDAESAFRANLESHPDHVPSLYFLTQHYAQRFDFDQAFRLCGRLEALAPEIAEGLQEDIWTLKRLSGRMEA